MSEDGTQHDFRVEQPGFSGSLQELLTALRSGRLPPSELDLLALVRSWLVHFEALSSRDLDAASEALPKVAQVLELKVRLLLPRQPRPDSEELLEEVAEAVEVLLDMENAIDYLRSRREDRRLLLPVRVNSPAIPRRERPSRLGPGRLAELAGRLRAANYFEIARESFSFREATSRMLELLRLRRRFSFTELRRDYSWDRVTVLFAALLELVRQGSVKAVQDGPYGELVVSTQSAPQTDGAPAELQG